MDLRESDQKMKPIVLLLLAAAVISVIGSTGVAYAAEGDAAGKYHPLALTTGTDKPGGGKPTEYYDTQKAVNNHFSKGTQLYSVDTSSDSVNVLAAKNKTMLVNKTQSDLTVVLEGTSYNLDDYEVRVIDTPASKSPKIVEAKPDANAPKVSIIGLNNGATLNGKVQFRADATDDAGVAKVEFFVDDENKHTDTTKPYVRTHDVSTLIDGSHTLYAVATDTSGNKKQSETVQFTVVDGIDVTAPSAKVTFPTNGRAVIGNIRLRADASDNRRVAKVDFYIDGEIKHTDTTSPYVRQHDTSTLTNGHHTVYVVATDDSGNIIKTAKKYFVVSGGIDETPPETRITNLKNGSVVSGNIQFKATASDDVSLAKVQFFLDGKDTHTDRTSPFVRSHSTKELSNGKHTLYTVATDTSGNKTKSASVTFTVRN